MRFRPPTPAAKTEFLDALTSWSGRPASDFSLSQPPCAGVDSNDEDAILATVFAALAADAPYYAPSHVLAILTSAIVRHQRHVDLVWEGARSSRPGQTADRTTWSELRKYEEMIGVLHMWHEALFDHMLGVAA